MSNDTQPEIRLPGFTEAWEQRKLGEVTQIIDTKHATAPISENKSKYKMIRTSSVRHGQLYPLKMDNVTEEVYETWSERIHLQAGDVVFSREAPMGESAVIPSDKNKYFLGQRMVAIRCYENINPYFIVSTFLAPKFRKEINIRNAESTTVANFGISSLKIYKIDLPSIREQTMIGHLFQQLDDTIALHQRKLDLLKETKKGFLQKMFPKNGAKVPEIRFPGFTEDWEERRLQEVVDRYDNLRIPITASKRVAGNTPYYGANGIQGYVEGYTHDGEFILVAEDGANDLKNYPVQYVDGKVWVNNHAHVIQAKENLADNMFLMNAIRSINIEPFLVGGGRAKLNADVLMKLEVIIPLKSEQQKIGAFFKQLDDTIALHQRKLDLLKETKKGFLQKMFV
ncbi:restriction endonuclease subunit S [Enterococcus faecium]|uniref:Restriction endonuclease subunit S n=1 Tax=Enterococcus faecium TaxID=1352 RepID=A0A6A8NL39_ENTFC|nr:restriction endonuclease subunit S [Enterococcus faecium]THE14644.1 restriction endonuclease subunit S [Enterococcus hirae]EGP4869229.1 restriction endonuclease subunit S [Enterococcus faecium]MBD9709515.1 restriction endonuclease subunit S [Enterococcus faecium]MTD24897.1 restriction endonuclease subunit S [Enterococcus faecium]MTD36689.1 restriction endonuclease subunit S [Enterococcus faecium]